MTGDNVEGSAILQFSGLIVASVMQRAGKDNVRFRLIWQ